MNDWSADRPATDDDQLDPRLLRSRKRLLDAATHLLSTGGVEAVTVEAVTRMSKVARATLYRHFGGTAQLLAATFERLLPRVEVSADSGSVRDQLIALLTAQADLIDQAPLNITTLAWLSIGSVGGDPADSAAITSLRSRVIEEYRQPFDTSSHSLTYRHSSATSTPPSRSFNSWAPSCSLASLGSARSTTTDACNLLMIFLLPASRETNPSRPSSATI